MGILVVLVGIILVVVGVKKHDNTLRNIGIAVILIGCILTAVLSGSAFTDGIQSGIHDSMNN